MATDSALSDAYAHFKDGDYYGALSASETPSSDPKAELGRLYLRATSQAHLQEFEDALHTYDSLSSFQKGHPGITLPEDFSFERGQAYYATKRFDKARECFLDSIHAGFRVATSHYYAGFISELLDDSGTALTHFQAILALPNDDEKIKQAALFQIAEIRYARSADKKPESVQRSYLADEVLPGYQHTIDFDSNSEIANGAYGRVDDVEAKLDALAPKMRNGNPIPRKPFAVHFAEDLGWDSNVANIADESSTNISNKATFFVKPSVLAKYQANWRDTWSFIPEAAADVTYYLQQGTPQIYQNDNANLSAALRTRNEHKDWQRPATSMFDLEYFLMLRDYQQMHQLSFYTRTYKAVAGELFRLFAFGPTSVKFDYQLYQSENPDRTANIPEVSVSQVVRISRWDLDNTLNFNYVKAHNSYYDERNYIYRATMFFPNFIDRWNFMPALNLAFKDTMKQSAVRGTEVNLNPTLDFSHGLGKHLSFHAMYSYTHYFSQDQVNYLYTEHVLTTSLREDF